MKFIIVIPVSQRHVFDAPNLFLRQIRHVDADDHGRVHLSEDPLHHVHGQFSCGFKVRRLMAVCGNRHRMITAERRFRRRFTCFLPFLDQCARAGYAVEEDGRWHLTPRGFLVSNQIIGGMLDALAADKQRRADAAARGDFRVNLD